MTRKISRLLAAAGVVLGLAPAVAYAQGTTISGQVTGTGGEPVVGASVSIPTLRVGGFTDETGRYSFSAPAEATGTTVTMIARRLGFMPSSVQETLTSAPIVQNFSLSSAATELQGIVVTALGLTREKSRLGTAQQQLTNAELNQTKALNLLDQMEGKVSGVTITGSGTQGGSTNIVIRGSNSITGSNQPLFVVDGVAISNRGRGGSPDGPMDFGSAIQDVNPDDIATMSVLKGPNAAALYGSRAANGVIVITTKKGSASGSRARTEINTNYTWDHPSILPEYQNLYGQGAQGQFNFVNGQGGGIQDFNDQSYGPRLDGRSTGCAYIKSTDPRYTGPFVYDTAKPCGQFTNVNGAPWVAHPDNVESFFNTGHTRSTTLAVSGGNERASARLSFGRDNITGYIPNNNFQKTSGLLNGSLSVTSRLSTDATLQYIHNNAINRPGVGYNFGILEQFVWFGRQIDMNALRNYKLGGATNNGPANREFNWNYNFHNNPFWMQYENPLEDTRDRFVGTVSVNYKLLEGVSAIARTGSDIYRYNIDQRWAQGNLQGNPAPADPNFFGGFNFVNDYSNNNTTDLIVTADRSLGSRVSVTATVGGSNRLEKFNTNTIRTAGISVAGIYNVSNAAITPSLSQFDSRRQVKSIFGAADFTFLNWFTVGGTARNDWSSTLPAGNNSYFYPSMSVSAVLTDAIPSLKNRVLTYAKIRASTARVGNDADPYQLRTTYTGLTDKFAGLPQFSLQDFIANPDLKPENTDAKEGGLELSFLDGRATLDFSAYSKATKNQIFTIPVSPTSGFLSKALNAGKISNKGIDFLLGVTPIQLDNGLQWTSTFNYSRNKSMVDELAPGISTFVIGSSWYVNLEARQGQPYGSIFGYAFARDPATGKIYTDRGLPVLASERKVLGNIQPKWTGGWNNTINFKNVTLSALLDMRHGGNIVSITNFFGEYSGVLKSTARGREVDWNKPGLVADGIDINTCAATGPCNGTPNTTNVTAEQWFQSIFPIMEPYVYDASWVKLRELRFGLDLPAKWASMLNARALSVALTGRNLHTWTKVPNIDPEFSYTIGNYQGVEFAALPNARTVGLSFRITP